MYPTKDEVLEGTVTHKPEVIRAIKNWKGTAWKAARDLNDENVKMAVIMGLIEGLAVCYQRPVTVVRGPRDCYSPLQKTIFLSKPSIITALHELAHHLFGPSELKACRWSVHLFKKTFPKAESKLGWDGHMRVRKHRPSYPGGPALNIMGEREKSGTTNMKKVERRAEVRKW